MPSEPHWLTTDQVTQYNRLAVDSTGEPFFVRDPAMLEGALASPRNHWHYGEDRISRLAATLLMALARDHPFEQGNKRTALLAARGFLEINGLAFRAPDDEAADAIIGMVEKQYTSAEFSEWFASYVVRPLRIRNTRRLRGRFP